MSVWARLRRWFRPFADPAALTPLQLGLLAERIAERSLRRRGARVLARRYRVRGGELDLVVHLDDSLVFVEVKSQIGAGMGPPEDRVTPSKQTHLIRAARQFTQSRPALAKRPWRFDVVTVIFQPRQEPIVEHIREAFAPRS